MGPRPTEDQLMLHETAWLASKEQAARDKPIKHAALLNKLGLSEDDLPTLRELLR